MVSSNFGRSSARTLCLLLLLTCSPLTSAAEQPTKPSSDEERHSQHQHSLAELPLLVLGADSFSPPEDEIQDPPGESSSKAQATTFHTAAGHSGSGQPAPQSHLSVGSSTSYRILLDLPDDESVLAAYGAGLETASRSRQEYLVADWILEQLLDRAFDVELLGGVTTHTFVRPNLGELARPGTDGFPAIVTRGTSNFTIGSGTVNDPIPDQGFTWRWVRVGGGSTAPTGSTTTNLEYRLRIHKDSDPGSIYCGDFEIYLSSSARGGAVAEHLVYNNLGARTDGGFDDDAADDADIYINFRDSSYFNGEDPNQQWYVYIRDTLAQDTGFLQYIEFRVHWQAPAVDLVATDVYFRSQPQNGGTLVSSPAVGQQLYAHFAYTVSASSSVPDTNWRLELPLSSQTLCTFSGTEPAGPRVGWCNSPWTVSAGTHSLHGELDYLNLVDETNENNNERFQNYIVSSSEPDIRIAPLSLSFGSSSGIPIFMELDWMATGSHSHRPSQSVVDSVIASFAAAGFDLTVDISNSIPHQATIDITTSPSQSPDVLAIIANHFDHEADNRYFYSLWVHNYSRNGASTSSSGIGDLPGRVHLVSLGSFTGQVGTSSHQSGTLIHEFGHNLGQKHGGSDHENYKPNYLSSMNYHYQLRGIATSLISLNLTNDATGFREFDYSYGDQSPLNENALDEGVGIGLGLAVDWDCDGNIENSVAKDIQTSNWCLADSFRSTIRDFDNWANVNLFLRNAASPRIEPNAQPSLPCIGWEEFSASLRQAGPGNVLPRSTPSQQTAVRGSSQVFTIFNDGDASLTVTSIALDSPASWISWSPAGGFTIPQGASRQVSVTVDLANAPTGNTTRRLLVHSNDPDESPYPGGIFLQISRPTSAPDLVVESPSVSASLLAPGQSYTLSLTTKNQGNATSPSISGGLHYLLSSNPSITLADLEMSTDSVSSLAPGQTDPDSDVSSAPSVPGTYWVGGCVDTVAGESTTTNQCSVGVQITVQPPAGNAPNVGVYRSGTWVLDSDGNQSWSAGVDAVFGFGQPTDRAVAGDWNGNGVDHAGIFRSGLWILDIDGSQSWTPGVDVVFGFGQPTDLPIVGDWNGDGRDQVGIFRAGLWILDSDGNRGWTPGVDAVFTYGIAADLPVSGDWNATGADRVGIFRQGTWVLDSDGNHRYTAGVDAVFGFGGAANLPVTGDWNDDGVDDPGLFSSGTWILDSDGSRNWTPGIDSVFGYGRAADQPLVGNWP